ncbi:putative MFS-family transport protein [Klebsiella pneumoniae]|uniref:Putative MFS-family transport protein n=1 Tax=Klebsiella pneumoniae TaxID=573 RepID=A0A377XW08_KLEPN|nr:putative MFS-family transport protein [Klebsiella pneumoniae]
MSGLHNTRAYWSGVLAMTLCVFVLIASEFMPVSLLTPIAGDLHITEGLAGQGIALSGALAVLTSLTISRLTGSLDRKMAAAGAHGGDGGLWSDYCPGVQFPGLYAGQSAHRDRHRRLLVDVGGNGHSACAATLGPPRTGHL